MNFFENQITEKERNDGLALFRVWEIHKEHYKLMPFAEEETVNTNSGNAANSIGNNQETLSAVLKGSAFYKDAGFREYPAIGDIVVAWENAAGESIIYRVLERKSKFVRLTAGSIGSHSDNTARQLVAANFDTIFLMESLNRDFNVRKMERYLVTAWESGGTPVVVLTKADLCEDVEEKVREMEAAAVGVPVIAVSAKDGTGLDELKKYAQPGLWSTGEGMDSSFEDILSLAGQCRFSDCRHESEPGCAVRAAIGEGNLSEGRLTSFKKLQREARHSAAKEAYRQRKTNAYKNMCKNQHKGRNV